MTINCRHYISPSIFLLRQINELFNFNQIASHFSYMIFSYFNLQFRRFFSMHRKFITANFANIINSFTHFTSLHANIYHITQIFLLIHIIIIVRYTYVQSRQYFIRLFVFLLYNWTNRHLISSKLKIFNLYFAIGLSGKGVEDVVFELCPPITSAVGEKEGINLGIKS